jgi:hypothetical protein
MHDVLKLPQLRVDFEGLGVQLASPISLAEADSFYASEISRYQSIARAIDLQPE